MAKSSGLGDAFFLSGYDLSGDINSLGNIGGGPALLDVTGIDKSAFERIGGLRDGRMEFVSYFNTAAGQAHPRLSTLPTTDVLATYCRGTTLGDATASLISKQINYDGTRADDGDFKFAVQVLGNAFGLEWGIQLTAGKRTDTAATNGTGVDQTTVSTSFGWQASLHVFAFTGTSVTVSIEDSADNITFAALSGATFTAATGITSERIASASPTATVRRYVRAVTTGTFTSATFAVAFVRNDVSTVF